MWQLVVNGRISQTGHWGTEKLDAPLTDTELGGDSAAINPCRDNLQATSHWFFLHCTLPNTWSKNHNKHQGRCDKSDKVHHKGLRPHTPGIRESPGSFKPGNATWLHFIGESSVYNKCHSGIQGGRAGAWKSQLAFTAAVSLRTTAGGRRQGREKWDEGGPQGGSTGNAAFCLGSLWHHRGQIPRCDMRFSSTWYKGFAVFHFWWRSKTLM